MRNYLAVLLLALFVVSPAFAIPDFVVINDPINNSFYPFNQNVSLNISISVRGATVIDQCWYRLDDTSNFTIAGCNATTMPPLVPNSYNTTIGYFSEGMHSIKFFMNRSITGEIVATNSATINFYIAGNLSYCQDIQINVSMEFRENQSVIPVYINFTGLTNKPVANSVIISSQRCNVTPYSEVAYSDYPLQMSNSSVLYSKYAINPNGTVTSSVVYGFYYAINGSFEKRTYSTDFTFPPMDDYSYIQNSWFNDTYYDTQSFYRTSNKKSYSDRNWIDESGVAGNDMAELITVYGAGDIGLSCNVTSVSSIMSVQRCDADDGFRKVYRYYYAWSPYVEIVVDVPNERYQMANYMDARQDAGSDVAMYFNGIIKYGNESYVHDTENGTYPYYMNMTSGIIGTWTNQTDDGLFWLYKTKLNQSRVMVWSADIEGTFLDIMQIGNVDENGEIIPANTSFWRTWINASGDSAKVDNAIVYFNGLVENPAVSFFVAESPPVPPTPPVTGLITGATAAVLSLVTVFMILGILYFVVKKMLSEAHTSKEIVNVFVVTILIIIFAVAMISVMASIITSIT